MVSECHGEKTPPRAFNLMFQTYVGPVRRFGHRLSPPRNRAGDFRAVQKCAGNVAPKVPFGIAQVGKAFRNEVTPRNFTFRSREFEQMELEFFIKPDEVVEAITARRAAEIPKPAIPANRSPTKLGLAGVAQYWVEERVRFYEGIGLSRETLGLLANAGGTGALRPRLRGHPVQVPVQRHVCRRGTGRHRRAQRF
jgi:glycyl-tRNA synthetase